MTPSNKRASGSAGIGSSGPRKSGQGADTALQELKRRAPGRPGQPSAPQGPAPAQRNPTHESGPA